MPTSRRHKPARRNATRRSGSPARHHLDEAREQPLIRGLRTALRSPGGHEMIEAVGLLIEAATPSVTDRWAETGVDKPTLPTVVESFVGTDIAETTAALHLIAAWSDDEVMTTRIRRELDARRQPMPPLVSGITHVRVTSVMLWHGDNTALDTFVLALDGPEPTPPLMLVALDLDTATIHDAATSFATQAEVDELFGAGEMENERSEVSLADARALIEPAIELGRMMIPPRETDTWPATRPFLTALCRSLPEGGTGYPLDIDDVDFAAVARQVMATDRYRESGLDSTPGSDDADIVETLLGLNGSYGVVDPLRWSPSRVGVVLLDRVPRKIVADHDYLSRIPAVFEVLIPASAEVRPTAPSVVPESLTFLADVVADYRSIIDGGPAPWEVDDEDWEDDDAPAFERLEGLAALVGGYDVLEDMPDDEVEPLSPVTLRFDDLPEAVAAAASIVDAQVTAVVEARFDPEWREECLAAVRRLIQGLADKAPDTLRRGKPAVTAAALLWAVGRANDLVGEASDVDEFRHAMIVGPMRLGEVPLPPRMTVRDLWSCFGVTGSTTTRARDLLRRLGYEPSWPHPDLYAIGDPDLLIANKRLRIAIERDRLGG